MKLFLFALCSVVFPCLVLGADVSANDVAKRNIEDMKKYEIEASKMDSHSISQEMDSCREVLRLKLKETGSIFGLFGEPCNLKSAGYMLVLEKRRKAGDGDAAFYHGINQAHICSVVSEVEQKNSTPVCSDALESLKFSANKNDPRAMKALGRIYSQGLGVELSKYVAADWFVKAAKQYQSENSRERALGAMESALNLVPDHPGAIALRNQLLK